MKSSGKWKNSVKTRAEKNKKDKTKTESSQLSMQEQPITVGSTVKIKGQSSVGEVLGINGKNAIVMFGMKNQCKTG